MKFSAFVFDWDDTLIASELDKKKIISAFCLSQGVSPREILAKSERFQLDRRGIVQLIIEESGGRLSQESYSQLVDQLSGDLDESVVTSQPLLGAEKVLKHLKSIGVPSCLNSATPESNLRAIVETRGWSELFHSIHGRPSSKIDNLKVIVSELRLHPQQILVVGNAMEDRESAHVLGCPFVLVENVETDLFALLTPYLLG